MYSIGLLWKTASRPRPDNIEFIEQCSFFDQSKICHSPFDQSVQRRPTFQPWRIFIECKVMRICFLKECLFGFDFWVEGHKVRRKKLKQLVRVWLNPTKILITHNVFQDNYWRVSSPYYMTLIEPVKIYMLNHLKTCRVKNDNETCFNTPMFVIKTK